MATQIINKVGYLSRTALRRTGFGFRSSLSNNDLNSSEDTNSLQTSHSADVLLSRARLYAASSNSPIAHHSSNGFHSSQSLTGGLVSLAAVNRSRSGSSDGIHDSVKESEVPTSSSVDAPATNDRKPTFSVGEDTNSEDLDSTSDFATQLEVLAASSRSNSPIHHSLKGFDSSQSLTVHGGLNTLLSLAAVNSRSSSSNSIQGSVTEGQAHSSVLVDAHASDDADGGSIFFVGEDSPKDLDSLEPNFPSFDFVTQDNWSPDPVQVSRSDSNGTLAIEMEPAKVPHSEAGLSKFTSTSHESYDNNAHFPARFYTVYSQPDVPAIQLDDQD